MAFNNTLKAILQMAPIPPRQCIRVILQIAACRCIQQSGMKLTVVFFLRGLSVNLNHGPKVLRSILPPTSV